MRDGGMQGWTWWSGAYFQAGNGKELLGEKQREGTAAFLIESHCIYSFMAKLTGN